MKSKWFCWYKLTAVCTKMLINLTGCLKLGSYLSFQQNRAQIIENGLAVGFDASCMHFP